MSSREPIQTHNDLPRSLPRNAFARSLLSFDSRAPGKPGLLGKLLLAAVGLLLIFAMVGLVWLTAHLTTGVQSRPPGKSLLSDLGIFQPTPKSTPQAPGPARR